MSKVQRISLAAILAGAIGAPAGVPAPIPREVLPMTPAPARLPVEGEFPSLGGATAWLNSPPLTPEGLRGKAVLVKLIWRMFRARVFGDRMAAIGQSLAARMRLALKQQDVPLWLDSPMTELITDEDGTVTGGVVERDGGQRRIHARRGVILASGGFDHDMTWRRQHLPVLEKDWSFGNPAAMGDGIRAGEKVGGSTDLLDEAWWFPAICWPDGRLQFMLNERMMPSQFVVNGDGKRFINEAAPYMDFAHAMIEGQRSGVAHIPCWLITDIRSFHRHVVADARHDDLSALGRGGAVDDEPVAVEDAFVLHAQAAHLEKVIGTRVE